MYILSVYSLLKVVSYNDLSVLSRWQENTNIVIDNINVERVQSFQYLGAICITNGASNIKQRLAMAVQALNNMQYLRKSASKELKLKVLRTCIFPIATYGCETWVLRKLGIKIINAFGMKCYRKILRIPWMAHRTNCSILRELHLPTKTSKTEILWPRYSPQWFREDNKARNGSREKKPRQRWEKDITDTFGTMAAASRVADDRHQFRRDIWASTS